MFSRATFLALPDASVAAATVDEAKASQAKAIRREASIEEHDFDAEVEPDDKPIDKSPGLAAACLET